MNRRPPTYRYLLSLFLPVLLPDAGILWAQDERSPATHATGFELEERGEVTLLRVLEPWPGGSHSSYALLPEGADYAGPREGRKSPRPSRRDRQ